VRNEDIVFHVGDVLHDDTLYDIGVLLKRYDALDNPNAWETSCVPVWKIWWFRSGEELWSEEGLRNLVAMDVFTCYSVE
tara:strand:- start:724 stop:960 length:237 start_codon:yes stop_codon:yes gene_type:complete